MQFPRALREGLYVEQEGYLLFFEERSKASYGQRQPSPNYDPNGYPSYRTPLLATWKGKGNLAEYGGEKVGLIPQISPYS